jgi:predicted DNA-binding antitoxin AbrB/MazE fold protein
MVRHVDAIFSHGAFRPVEPLALPEGTRVHLSVVEEEERVSPARGVPKIFSPKLAHPEEAADFTMEVKGLDDAGI